MIIRRADKNDVPSIVQLLADDTLGMRREDFQDPLPQAYYQAFFRIERDSNQELIVMESLDHQILGTLQLTFIPYLSYRGGIRAQIEAVRIKNSHRGQGLGKILFDWAIARSKVRGAVMVQLTSDKTRLDALKFYQKLGFTSTHEGFKLIL
jgi:ribosomal protein S18 acetylase RimI-like enzyme